MSFLLFSLLFPSCTVTQHDQTVPLDTEEKISSFMQFAHVSRADYDRMAEQKELVLFGESNGYSICEYVNGSDLRIVDEEIGGIMFRSSFVHNPYALGYYAVGQTQVLPLKEAYDRGAVDIAQVAKFTPTAPAGEQDN